MLRIYSVRRTAWQRLWRRAMAGLACLALLSVLMPAQPVQAAVRDWQKGASIYPETALAYSGMDYNASVRQLAAQGATHVNLPIPYYQSNTTSSDIQPGWNTPADSTLRSALRIARANGLQPTLVFKLDTLSGEWHAEIEAQNRAVWFKAYGDALVHYARLAEQENAAMYSIGTELWGMTSNTAHPGNAAEWEKLIKRVRQVYSGPLTYGSQHSGNRSEKMDVSFWPLLDYIGVSAYFPLQEAGATPEDALHNSWRKWDREEILPLYQKYQKPIIFTEIGYRSIEGSHVDPWSFGREGKLDLEAQRRNYAALFTYWHDKPYLAGVYWWGWIASPVAGGSQDMTFTPQNKPAMTVIKNWYTWGQAEIPYTAAPTHAAWPPQLQKIGASPVLKRMLPNVNQQAAAQVLVRRSQVLAAGCLTDATWVLGEDGQYTLKLAVRNTGLKGLYFWFNQPVYHTLG